MIGKKKRSKKVEAFPPVEFSMPDGLLAFGGDLSPKRLVRAYRSGIFPWYNEDDPVLWWSPDPRCVIFPKEFTPSRSLRKSIKKENFKFTIDYAFTDVMWGCASPRKNADGTWIGADVKLAYRKLHEQGIAHSVETWKDGRLVGGLYGLAIGGVFFGESMFNFYPDASKAALSFLVERLCDWDFDIIDCQVSSPHLLSLGAVEIPRAQFMQILQDSVDRKITYR